MSTYTKNTQLLATLVLFPHAKISLKSSYIKSEFAYETVKAYYIKKMICFTKHNLYWQFFFITQ